MTKQVHLRFLLPPLVSLLALTSTAIYAEGTAVRGPAVPDGTFESVNQDTGVIDLNPGRTPVTVDTGYTAINSSRVDTDNGVIGGYAEFDQNDPLLVPVGTPLGSSATGALTFESTLAGPVGSAADITLALAFDGEFLVNDGLPSLLLFGNLSATTFSPTAPLDGTMYQSQLIFEMTAVNEVYEPLPLITGVRTDLFGGEEMEYEGAEATVFSSLASNLDALVTLTIPVTVGETLIVASVLSGIAGPEPGDAPLDDGIDTLASAGAVDFSQTGILSVTLPEGFSLSGNDSLLQNIVTTRAVVTAPASFSPALLAGLLLISARIARGSQKPHQIAL